MAMALSKVSTPEVALSEIYGFAMKLSKTIKVGKALSNTSGPAMVLLGAWTCIQGTLAFLLSKSMMRHMGVSMYR